MVSPPSTSPSRQMRTPTRILIVRSLTPGLSGATPLRAPRILKLDSNIRSLVVSSPWNIRSVQEHDPGQPRTQPLLSPARTAQPSGAARPRRGFGGPRGGRFGAGAVV